MESLSYPPAHLRSSRLYKLTDFFGVCHVRGCAVPSKSCVLTLASLFDCDSVSEAKNEFICLSAVLSLQLVSMLASVHG
jgi:hypothetical protein